MRQLALDIRLAAHAVFDSFYGGPNRLAVATLQAMAVDRGPPLAWLWGMPATGKSHLLQAAVAAAHGRGGACAYLPLGDLAGGPATVLDGMGALDLVALDDVETVAGGAEWERALLRLFEQLMARGARLVTAADVPPSAAGVVLADLASRLAAGAVFRLEALADPDLVAALQCRARWLGLSLPAETAEFVLARVDRHPGSLFQLLDQLDRAALAAQRQLTIPFVRSVLEPGR